MSWKIKFVSVVNYILVISGFKFHGHLIKGQMKSLFDYDQDAFYNKGYEHNHSIRKRENANAKIELEALNQKYDLYLEERIHVLLGKNTPMYIASMNSFHGFSMITYNREEYPLSGRKIKYYHNRSKRTALTVHIDNNTQHINGEIGDCLTIRSISEKVKNELLNKNSNSSFGISNHIIIKKRNYTDSSCNWIRNIPEDELFINKLMEDKDLFKSFKSNHKVERRDTFNDKTLDVVYPEVLVVIDYETYKAHNKDLEELGTYVAAFFNGVDLRFREIKNPEIRLNIAGLVVNTDEKVQPYLKRDLLNGKFFKNITNTIQRTNVHFNNKFPGHFDVIAVLTPYFLESIESKHSFGSAIPAEACSIDFSTALITDEGGFSGIFSATLMLGYLFGATGEVNKLSVSPGGPCTLDNRFVTEGTEYRFHWSQCSKTAIQYFLRSDNVWCLRNKPDVGLPHQKILPGKLLTRDVQCDRMYSGSVGADEDCNFLKCKKCSFFVFCNEEWDHRQSPAEGTPCGNGRICLNGTCVADSINFR